MGMIEAYKLYWKNALKFDGRSRRAEYWWPVLINILIFAIAAFLLLFYMESKAFSNRTIDIYYEILVIINYVILFLPTMSVLARRMHDVGVSGVRGIILSVIMIIYNVYSSYLIFNNLNFITAMFGRPSDDPFEFMGIVLLIMSIITIIYGIYIFLLTIQDSEIHENKYGKSNKYATK